VLGVDVSVLNRRRRAIQLINGFGHRQFEDRGVLGPILGGRNEEEGFRGDESADFHVVGAEPQARVDLAGVISQERCRHPVDGRGKLHAEGGERPQMFPWRMAEGVGKLDGFVVADPVPGEDHVALAGEIGAEVGD